MARLQLTFSTLPELQTHLDNPAPRDIRPEGSLGGSTLVGNVNATVSDFRYFGDGVDFAIQGRFRVVAPCQDFLVQNIRCLEGQVPVACDGGKNGEFRHCTSGHGWSQSFSAIEGSTNVLFYRCLAIYALSYATPPHPDGEHSKGFFLVSTVANPNPTFPDNITLDECGTILCASRLPNAQGNLGTGEGGYYSLRNCVFYGWGGPELEEMGPHFGCQFDRGARGDVARSLWLGNDHSTGPHLLLDAGRGSPINFDRSYYMTNWDQGQTVASKLVSGDVLVGGEIPAGVTQEARDACDAQRLYNELVIKRMPAWGAQPWASGETDAYADLVNRTGTPGVPTHTTASPLLYP